MDIKTFDHIALAAGYTTRHRLEIHTGTAALNYARYPVYLIDVMKGNNVLATYSESIIENWINPLVGINEIASLHPAAQEYF